MWPKNKDISKMSKQCLKEFLLAKMCTCENQTILEDQTSYGGLVRAESVKSMSS